MATSDEIFNEIIDPMKALFGKPYGCRTEEEVYLAQGQYLEAFEPFTADLLRRAWISVRFSWTKTTWPPIAVIRAAIKENQPARSQSSRPPEHDLFNPEEAENLRGVPLSRIDEILDDGPALSCRAWLRNLAISAGAGVEGEDISRQETPETPFKRPISGTERLVDALDAGAVTRMHEGRCQGTLPDGQCSFAAEFKTRCGKRLCGIHARSWALRQPDDFKMVSKSGAENAA